MQVKINWRIISSSRRCDNNRGGQRAHKYHAEGIISYNLLNWSQSVELVDPFCVSAVCTLQCCTQLAPQWCAIAPVHTLHTLQSYVSCICANDHGAGAFFKVKLKAIKPNEKAAADQQKSRSGAMYKKLKKKNANPKAIDFITAPMNAIDRIFDGARCRFLSHSRSFVRLFICFVAVLLFSQSLCIWVLGMLGNAAKWYPHVNP